MAETETIDRLFLELSQFTTARTAREQAAITRVAELERIIKEAPHDGCHMTTLNHTRAVPEGSHCVSCDCNCWKAAALGKEKP